MGNEEHLLDESTERDIDSVVRMCGVTRSTVEAMMTRFGGPVMVMVHIQNAQSSDPGADLELYGRVDGIVSRLSKDFKDLRPYGLTDNQIIHLRFMRGAETHLWRKAIIHLGDRGIAWEAALQLYQKHGENIYAPNFDVPHALQILEAEAFSLADRVTITAAERAASKGPDGTRMYALCPQTSRPCRGYCGNPVTLMSCLEPDENLGNLSESDGDSSDPLPLDELGEDYASTRLDHLM